jgi:predicted Rossmann-fold nucleotide-binding protein
MGGDFWRQLYGFARDTMLKEGVISRDEVEFIHDVPTVEEALRVIRNGRGP